jgi:hypothetical protein
MEPKYIGIDLHKEFFQACAVDGQGTRLWEGRFPRTDGGLLLLQTHCSATTAVAVEASGPTWAFVDALMPSGARLCVVGTRKTKLIAGISPRRSTRWSASGRCWD